MVQIEKDKCERCLSINNSVIANLAFAEEFALRDETDRALVRLHSVSETKMRMDDLGCLMSAESKLFDNEMAKLGDAIARKDKREVASLTSDAASHLVKALQFILCGE